MISKIIQKEKERQEEFFRPRLHVQSMTIQKFRKGQMKSHKQSLINLKEYMETELDQRIGMSEFFHTDSGRYWGNDDEIQRIEEDIAELTKMIERYK
jgi:hypothetical protein